MILLYLPFGTSWLHLFVFICSLMVLWTEARLSCKLAKDSPTELATNFCGFLTILYIFSAGYYLVFFPPFCNRRGLGLSGMESVPGVHIECTV